MAKVKVKQKSPVLNQQTAEWLIYNDFPTEDLMDKLYPEKWGKGSTTQKKLRRVIKEYKESDEQVYEYPLTHHMAGLAITSKGRIFSGGHVTNTLSYVTDNKKLFIIRKGKRHTLRDLMEDAGFIYDHETVVDTIKKHNIHVKAAWLGVGKERIVTILDKEFLED